MFIGKPQPPWSDFPTDRSGLEGGICFRALPFALVQNLRSVRLNDPTLWRDKVQRVAMISNELLVETHGSVKANSAKPPCGRLRINNILCPVDFSEFSARAFTYAACLARQFRSRLYVQHTVNVPAPEPLHSHSVDSRTASLPGDANLNQVGIEMRRLTAVVRLHVPEVHLLVQVGEFREQLLENIRDRKIDLVVMGTRGHDGFNCLKLGSVTERMLREAHCPVLFVCRPTRDFVTPDDLPFCHLKTILVPTDFSADSLEALALALKWASVWSARVILFHAADNGLFTEQGRIDSIPEFNRQFDMQIPEAWEAVQHQVPAIPARNCKILYEVRLGSAKEQILQLAEERNADLIVIGSGRLDNSGASRSSTTSEVVRDGRFPVLVARRSGTGGLESLAGAGALNV